MTFRRIPRSSCNEALRVVQEAWEDFTPKVSTVGASSSQEERSPGTSKSRGFARVITVAPQVSLTLCCSLLLEHPAQLVMARLVGNVYSGNLALYTRANLCRQRGRGRNLSAGTVLLAGAWDFRLVQCGKKPSPMVTVRGSQWLDVNSLLLCPRPLA